MTIARDGIAVTTFTQGDGQSSEETFSHEIDSDTDLLVACVEGFNLQFIDDVTYDGVSFTKLANTQQVSGDGSRVQIWIMKAADLPSPGTYDVVVTAAPETTSEMQAVVVGFQGIDQTTTVRDSDGAIASAETVAVPTLTTVAGDWVVGLLGIWMRDVTGGPTSNGTRLAFINNGGDNDSNETSYLVADDTTTDLSWSWTTSVSVACGGAAFIPAVVAFDENIKVKFPRHAVQEIF